MNSILSSSLALWITIAGCGGSPVEPVAMMSSGTVVTPGELSFQNNILPIFTTYGCVGCHGGTSGLSVGTVRGLLVGGDHGPSIVSGDAGSSILMKKISVTPPFGSRMPFGGPYLPDSTAQVIATWINQGAKNN